MSICKTIAVVGGGSIGVSYCYQLLLEMSQYPAGEKLNILLFEPSATPGAGQAYAKNDLPCNLLNTRADTMSIVANQPQNFLDWLHANEYNWRHDFPNLEVAPEQFLPRSLFGRYLEDAYRNCVQMADGLGVTLTHIQDEVIDLIPTGTGTCVDTKNHAGFLSDFAVVCCGNMPSTNFREFRDHPQFFASPYPGRQLGQTIGNNESVAIIGSSLSAIDAVVSLSETGHQGKMVCVSRNGRFPSVRGQFNEKVKLKKLTKENLLSLARQNRGKVHLDTLIKLVVEEFELASNSRLDLNQILNAEIGMHDYLTDEIDSAASENRIWQSIVYATNGIIDLAWHLLSAADQRRFYEKFRSLWMCYRVSFPLQNAQKLRSLLKKDRLVVHRGFSNLEYCEREGMFLLHINDETRGFNSTIKAKYVINATCYSTDVTTCDWPLIRNLLRRGLSFPRFFVCQRADFMLPVFPDVAC